MAQPDQQDNEYVSVREFYTEMTKLKIALALNTAAVVWAISGRPAPGAAIGAIQVALSFR